MKLGRRRPARGHLRAGQSRTRLCPHRRLSMPTPSRHRLDANSLVEVRPTASTRRRGRRGVVVNTGAGNDNVVISRRSSPRPASRTTSRSTGRRQRHRRCQRARIPAGDRAGFPGLDHAASATGSPSFRANPQLVALADGGFAVAWRSCDKPRTRSSAARCLPPTARPSTVAISWSPPPNRLASQTADHGAGRWRVRGCTWTVVFSGNGSNSDVRGQVFAADGTPIDGSDFLVSTTDVSASEPADHGAGEWRVRGHMAVARRMGRTMTSAAGCLPPTARPSTGAISWSPPPDVYVQEN